MLYSFLVLLCATVCFGWLWHRQHFSFWQKNNLPSIPITPILGNVKDLLFYRCCFGDQFRRLYENKVAVDSPLVGIHVLHNHALLLRAPELIKRVLVKDFSAFASRFETTDPVGDAMGSLNLFFAKYDIWKAIHSIFTPLFAHAKIKQMYPLLQEIGKNLEVHITQICITSIVIEVKEMCALFTTDLIASLAFGVQAKSLENPWGEFRRMCIEVNDPRPKRIFHLFVMFFFPQMVQHVGTRLYSPEYEHFMRHSIAYVTNKREETNTKRFDLIDIFINLKHNGKTARDNETTNKQSVVQKTDFFSAQAAFFLLAGFDTSSSTIAFALYELAKNQHIQKRVRRELQQALQSNDGSLSYNCVQELHYMSMVVDEILRMYPPTAFLDRCCTTKEGYKLDPWSSYKIPLGMPVYISVLGLHRDAKFWPEPNRFDPERFSPEQRRHITPMTYLPFGSGPRGCIGNILGLLQVKIGLIHILKNYFVTPCEKTPKKIKFHPKTFVLTAESGTYLKFLKDKLY